MTIGRLLGALLLSVLVSAPAGAQVTCAECKATALADASQCRAHAAPDVGLLATCGKKYAEMGQACEAACKAEAGAMAAQCADCVKAAEAETKKCAALPPEVRAACEARASSARKSCEDKSCPAVKAK